MHRRRQREENRAPNRAASPMHRRCGTILRPHLLRLHLGGLDGIAAFSSSSLLWTFREALVAEA
eukprot:6959264-Pyramimonas_sp.AAC.1